LTFLEDLEYHKTDLIDLYTMQDSNNGDAVEEITKLKAVMFSKQSILINTQKKCLKCLNALREYEILYLLENVKLYKNKAEQKEDNLI
jgi:hypothetical protein